VLALRAKPYGLGGSRFARLALGRKLMETKRYLLPEYERLFGESDFTRSVRKALGTSADNAFIDVSHCNSRYYTEIEVDNSAWNDAYRTACDSGRLPEGRDTK
jgi:hypothetical protein